MAACGAARTAAGLSQDQVAEKIAYSSLLVSIVEKCRRIPILDFAERCDAALGTGGNLARLQPLVAAKVFPSWFRPFAELEKSATSLRSWESSLVPGLLQVEGYARAVLRAAREADDDAVIDQATAARMERQAILHGDSPPFCWFVIDEAALRRPIGAPAVFAE
jgi:transcriptional regulator with XRE-family HTH domain